MKILALSHNERDELTGIEEDSGKRNYIAHSKLLPQFLTLPIRIFHVI